jgi:hypothetical protein
MKKVILLLIPVALLLSFKKENSKPPTIEDCIEVYYNSAAAYNHATTDAEKLEARTMVVGYKNPLDFDDPYFEDKLEEFLSTKFELGCLGHAAGCFLSFFQCLKRDNCHAPVGMACPPDPYCYFALNECLKYHGCTFPQ